MTKQKDFYWTTTKDEFTDRLKVLKTPYERDVWNYLQSYIIRGAGAGETWSACYNIFKQSNVVATSIGLTKMCRDLGVSDKKIRNVLKDLDKNNFIIKYTSKNGKKNNTNIYIMGFLNINTIDDNNVFRTELYLTNVMAPMTKSERDKILYLYDRQLGIVDEIKNITDDLREIQYRLFGMNVVEPIEMIKKLNEV